MQETIDTQRTPRVQITENTVFETGSSPTHQSVAYGQKLVAFSLLLADLLLALAVWKATAALLGYGEARAFLGLAAMGVVPGLALWVGLRALLGLYPGYGLDHVEELRRQTQATLVALGLALAVALGSGVWDTALVAAVSFATLLVLTPLIRYSVKRILLRAELWGKPVVVIGSREAGLRLLNVLRKEWQFGLKPMMAFDQGKPSTASYTGVEFSESPVESMKLARDRGVDTIIFAMPHTRRHEVAELVGFANTIFRYIIVMPNLDGITNSAVVARDFAGTFGVEIKHNLLDPWSRRIKRALDLLLTVAGGVLIGPLLLAVALLVKLDSSGPAFYGHRRLEADGRHFRCWKFRTMYTDAEQRLDEYLQGNPDLRAEWEQNFKLRNDPRVTRVGRFLRKTSLDELPQLWNVLRGEMSLVGPRPIVDAEIPKYGTVYGMYRRIKPGISGFWQVSGRSDTSYSERVRLDAYYVHNWSVWLDLVILARTVRSVLLSRGAY
jgi:Undecaprenyl-phosphate galactose phosphotransferase WbaP